MDNGHIWPHGDESGLLPAPQRDDLADLNYQFLILARGENTRITVPLPCSLDDLSQTELKRLARCPFALFRVTLRAASRSAEPGIGYEANTSRSGEQLTVLAAGFCRVIASLGSEASALVLGLADAERRALLSNSLADLQTLNRAGALTVDANFDWSPVFWRSLLAAVREPGETLIRHTRLHGMQLLAAAAGGLIATKR